MKINENKSMKNKLFIICPFCQLENHLRNKYGNDIFFMTTTAGILNLEADEISTIKNFIQRENITDIYLISDIGCNFIEEAIKNEKEFGLLAEQQLRSLIQNMLPKINSTFSRQEVKKIVAETNVQQQAKYLASENILNYEITSFEIKIHTLITNKHEIIVDKFKLN